MRIQHRLIALVSTCLLLTTGCMTQEEWQRFWARDGGSQPEPNPRLISKSQATRGTVGELVTVDGLRLLQVRGFGLVVDLPGTGGGDGPDKVKRHLVKEMRRQENAATVPGPAPATIIAGRDTAMVEVRGLAWAGARPGDRFDVVLRALGTQTTSLAGGRLVLCNLKLSADSIDAILGGKILATARGPVFVSPIGLEKEVPSKIDLHTGLVLGGGVVKKPRSIRLVLNDPSPSIATRIVDRLNSRYGSGDPVAVGKSFSTIELAIPKNYRRHKRLFLEHALHTTLNADPAALERRAKALVKEITHPDAEFESIGAAWEAIGRVALPHIRELYHHSLPAASYYAARTGTRMRDNAGVEALAKYALDPKSSFRLRAIEELGNAVTMHAAGEYLRKVLNGADPTVRIRAYKALRRRPHPAIKSWVLYEDNVVLDVVDSTGPFLIFTQRSMMPRIAIFGRQMCCKPPAMYPGERRDDRFLHTQISARIADEHLTLICKNKHTGRTSPMLEVPLQVPKLIRFLGDTPIRNEDKKLAALGIPYDEIVDVLYTFCETGTISARFMAEDLTGLETGLDISPEREESEF